MITLLGTLFTVALLIVAIIWLKIRLVFSVLAFIAAALAAALLSTMILTDIPTSELLVFSEWSTKIAVPVATFVSLLGRLSLRLPRFVAFMLFVFAGVFAGYLCSVIVWKFYLGPWFMLPVVYAWTLGALGAFLAATKMWPIFNKPEQAVISTS
ncbi:hypothetical protein [Sulfuriflexus mobilis]|uniref:hypothetical protein n=1 Tax=Sulfuriflexus mobilis TaxID=1811807 RepID=UPI000F83BC86|nr:hypothetical protein [Sulfuriflexus mobilis]